MLLGSRETSCDRCWCADCSGDRWTGNHVRRGDGILHETRTSGHFQSRLRRRWKRQNFILFNSTLNFLSNAISIVSYFSKICYIFKMFFFSFILFSFYSFESFAFFVNCFFSNHSLIQLLYVFKSIFFLIFINFNESPGIPLKNSTE